RLCLGLGPRPAHLVAPAEGRLVIFPSYMWHGTLPFESVGHRMTVAFDAMPQAMLSMNNILV
ncbi:MAG: hypothetical protein IBJ05_01405, partial [Blastomonas sp.]|nr:hypothetical protein [Blastomonas sp.]